LSPPPPRRGLLLPSASFDSFFYAITLSDVFPRDCLCGLTTANQRPALLQFPISQIRMTRPLPCSLFFLFFLLLPPSLSPWFLPRKSLIHKHPSRRWQTPSSLSFLLPFFLVFYEDDWTCGGVRSINSSLRRDSTGVSCSSLSSFPPHRGLRPLG